jgi:hypothetical protein
MVISAIISKDEEVWVRDEVESVSCVAPEYRLDDRRKGHKVTLMKHSLSNFEGLFR